VIKHVKRNEIDVAKWNKCIENDKQHLPYGLVEYLDVVAANWQALVLNDYEMVMPLPIRKKYFVNYIYRPIYAPQLGVFSQKSIGENIESDYLQFYKSIPNSVKLIDFEVHPKMPVIEHNGHFIEKPNYILTLDKPYEKLKANYKNNTRRAISKALEKGISIQISIASHQILQLLDNKQVNISNQFSEQEKQITLQLINTLVKNKIGKSIGIYAENNQLQAVVFYIKYKSRIVNLLNISTQQAKKNGWISVLIDYIINTNANSDCFIDFEGSSIKTIARFFKSFGAENKPIYHWQWNGLPAIVKWLKA